MPYLSHWWEVLVLVLIVLIIVGPGKLPLVGGAVGAAVKHLRRAVADEPVQPAAKAAPLPGADEAAKD